VLHLERDGIIHKFRVFCVGSNKTGTTSIEHAVKQFGLSPIPSDKAYGLYLGGGLNHSKENMVELFKKFELRKYKYNFFSDIPFNLLESHKMLYELFPDSYFILLTRDANKWFNSVLNWIKQLKCQTMYNWVWGIEFTVANRTEIIDRYHKRNNGIIQFFNHSPKFLVLDIDEEYKYPKICKFLNKEIINKPFPYKNQSLYL